MPPEYFRVYRMMMAPNTMISTPMAVTMPCSDSAAMYPAGRFHAPMAPSTQTSQAKGMARVEGQRMPTMSTRATRMGNSATNASSSNDIKTLLFCCA